MSPRRSAAEALETRRTIVSEAADLASLEGLEGLTIGTLASRVSMSKAGVMGHFESKEDLQLAALDHGVLVFTERVWKPVEDLPAGAGRLAAIADTWIAYLRGNAFAGGCLITQTSVEFDGRPGRVRDAIAAVQRRWDAVLVAECRAAGLEDPEQVAFEFQAFAVAANQAIQLFGDHERAERARRAMRRVVGG